MGEKEHEYKIKEKEENTEPVNEQDEGESGNSFKPEKNVPAPVYAPPRFKP